MRSTISRAARSTAWSPASGRCRGRRGWRSRWCARYGGDSAMSEAQGFHQQDYQRPELVCPAGTPAALRAAVDAGADAVYCGLQNETNARNFPGLNFTPAELEQSIAYAHARQAKVLLAVNTFKTAGRFDLWRDAVDTAARLGVDAMIVGDMGVADYAARTHPQLRLHLSVQAGASS